MGVWCSRVIVVIALLDCVLAVHITYSRVGYPVADFTARRDRDKFKARLITLLSD